MKEKTNLQTLLAAILLIIAGVISPSNGLDDRIYKRPMELIITAFTIVFVISFIYVYINSILQKKHLKKEPINYNNNLI